MAPRADIHDCAIDAEFRVCCARSVSREISFTIRALRDKFFSALVLITK